jgi:hypothetical protein
MFHVRRGVVCVMFSDTQNHHQRHNLRHVTVLTEQ